MCEDLTVSIVIPTFQHSRYISACLDSLLLQTYTKWEALIINNFSTDNTLEIINSYQEKKFKVYNFRNNGVIAASRNKGIAEATGDVIAFIDSDDFWYPNKLSVCMNNIYQGADIIFHDMDMYDEGGVSLRKRMKGKYLRRPVFESLMISTNPIINSSVLVKKDVVQKVNGLSVQPDLVTVEDFDLWLKISRVTENFLYIPRSMGGYRVTNTIKDFSPDRTMKIISVYNAYLPFLKDRKRKNSERIMNYIKAKHALQRGEWKNAVNRLINSLSLRLPMLTLKALVFLIRTLPKSFTKRY